MAEQDTAVIPHDTRAITLGAGEVVAIIPQTFEQVYRMASIIVASGVGPKGMSKEACAVAIMAGAEVGVAPMASVQNIAVINGRPCMWGDLIVALVQASGKLEYLSETWDDKTQTATVRIKRIGKPEHVETFGPNEAKRAKLSGKDLYQSYPQRMHGWRAKTYAIRSEFSDVLKGLSVREEVEDYIDVEAVPTRTAIATPQPLNPAPETADPPTEQGDPPPPDATTGRTIEDEIHEIGEQLGKASVEVAALIKQHANTGTLDSLRDQFRLLLKKQAKG